MNVALPDELERRVNESVEQGHFANRDEFFTEAAELLLELRHGNGSPVPVDEHWDERVGSMVEQARLSGDAIEMSDHDWEEIERQGLTLMRAKKKA